MTRPKFVTGSAICLAILVMVAGTNFLLIRNKDHSSAISTAREWARLSEFPDSAENLKVESNGNLFSREFTITFDAPPSDSVKWINESPGTKDIKPIENGSLLHYKIDPGAGAAWAEVTFNHYSGRITIHTYWS